VSSQEELDEAVSQMVMRAKRNNQEPTKERILNESIIGYIDSIKGKIKQAEEFGVRKMVIIVRGGPSIKDPMKLFHDEIMQ